tara:strand:- start:1820 stop:3283 length:1464 start_codon:yes stop_codon:yes gene_type:complete
MRKAFGKFITELAEKDKDVILLVGDIGFMIFDEFREKFPDRFLNLGICEQSIIGLASGMALEGFKPYVYTITPFLIERPFEQVKLDIDQQNVNVKLVGYADYPTQGPTHSELDAEKLMSLLHNTKSYFPKNSEETKKALEESYEHMKPSFISLKKDKNLNKKMKEKVLVTGGAGYAGSVLVPKLLKEYDVRVIDLMMFPGGLDSVKDKCEIIEGDIRDKELLKKSLQDIDYVIHLAAISNDPCSDLDPELTKQVNFEATKNLVELSKQAGVKRFIFASTSSVYGIKKEPNVTEDLSLNPLTIYSKTKTQSEEVVREANDENFTTVIIRPATICGYSPRLRLDLTVNILTEHAIKKNLITVFGGSQKRPNIHIDDITDYYVQLLKIPKEKIAGETFNAGYENHTVMEIAEMIKEIIGDEVKIERTETKDIRSYHISSEKIKNKLGLTPKKTIKDAVLDLKNAFDSGLIPNHLDSIYRNIDKMKELNLK